MAGNRISPDPNLLLAIGQNQAYKFTQQRRENERSRLSEMVKFGATYVQQQKQIDADVKYKEAIAHVQKIEQRRKQLELQIKQETDIRNKQTAKLLEQSLLQRVVSGAEPGDTTGLANQISLIQAAAQSGDPETMVRLYTDIGAEDRAIAKEKRDEELHGPEVRAIKLENEARDRELAQKGMYVRYDVDDRGVVTQTLIDSNKGPGDSGWMTQVELGQKGKSKILHTKEEVEYKTGLAAATASIKEFDQKISEGAKNLAQVTFVLNDMQNVIAQGLFVNPQSSVIFSGVENILSTAINVSTRLGSTLGVDLSKNIAQMLEMEQVRDAAEQIKSRSSWNLQGEGDQKVRLLAARLVVLQAFANEPRTVRSFADMDIDRASQQVGSFATPEEAIRSIKNGFEQEAQDVAADVVAYGYWSTDADDPTVKHVRNRVNNDPWLKGIIDPYLDKVKPNKIPQGTTKPYGDTSGGAGIEATTEIEAPSSRAVGTENRRPSYRFKLGQ